MYIEAHAPTHLHAKAHPHTKNNVWRCYSRSNMAEWILLTSIPSPRRCLQYLSLKLKEISGLYYRLSEGITLPIIFSILSSTLVLHFTIPMGKIIWIFLFILPSPPTPFPHVRCPLRTSGATDIRHGLATCLAYPTGRSFIDTINARRWMGKRV